MGLSTFDIPTAFLYPNQRIAFLNWIAAIPTNESAKRALLSTWSRATSSTLTAADYNRALNRI